MADGLLLSRRERIRLFWQRLGAAVGPTAALAIGSLALGARVTAIVFAVLGGLVALCVATSARTVRGAAIAGVVTLAVIVLFAGAVNWLAGHPILKD
jgi:hypothetical protein